MPSRPATPDDTDELVRLREVMLRTLNRRTWDDEWRAPARHILREQLGAPGTRLAAFVVDRAGGGLASCAVGSIDQRLGSPGNPSGRTGYVFSVATDEDQRGRGHSRNCLTALLQWFREQGVTVADLHASEDGLRLYESLGFVRKADPSMRLHL